MAVLWEKFFPYAQPHVPGCPEIVITAHLQEAAAEFCARSEIWRFDIERFFTSKGASDYDIDVPTGAVLENIHALYLDGHALRRVTDRHFDTSTTTPMGTPSHFSIYQDSQIRLYPTPDKKYTLEGAGVLKPKLTATGVEDYIFETYGRSIAYGAIAQLVAIPGKEWTNPELAMFYHTRFHRDIADAKTRDTRRAGLRVSHVGFDRTVRRGS